MLSAVEKCEVEGESAGCAFEVKCLGKTSLGRRHLSKGLRKMRE